MKYAMLSQPMGGKEKSEIEATRAKAIKHLEGLGYTVVNTWFDHEWYDKESPSAGGEIVHRSLFFLAKSIEKMSLCHAVYFCKGWESARGCKIEHESAKAYGLEMLYE